MKVKDLIQRLSDFPEDMEVCIFDHVKNTADASDEPTSAGIYKDFDVYQAHTDEELQELKEEFPNTTNFIALEFTNEDKETDEVIDLINNVIQSVKAMRNAQKNYFKTRTKEDLIESKRLESLVDKGIKETENLLLKANFKPADSGSEQK